MHSKKDLLYMAEKLKPSLNKRVVYPKKIVEVEPNPDMFQGWEVFDIYNMEYLHSKSFSKGDSFIVDFKEHIVGYLNLSVKWIGYPPGSPLRLRLIFGEMPCEVAESFDEYSGTLSRAWLQDEIINIDSLPAQIQLPRRYAFRYLKIEVLETSPEYEVMFTNIHCTAVTSANTDKVPSLPDDIPQEFKELDSISIRTLQNCMQTVFEDGPKRDRRLWMGDLRLQALVNYYTFKNYDLVKRCLYLFAGLTKDGDKVPSCVYEKPEPVADHLRLFDYALFFVPVLYDYYSATKDRKTLLDLWPIAYDQIRLALDQLDEKGIVVDSSSWWCFIDWHPELNKQAPAQGVLIYCLKKGLLLAQILNLDEESRFINNKIKYTSEAALNYLWDDKTGFFISGEQKQISWASQVWMILADIMDKEKNADLLKRLFKFSDAIKPVTPYMYHHIIEAMILSGMKQEAMEIMLNYWGGMVRAGADTFWEVYNREDQFLSPYGSHLINSYCHAWSCTPAYFIRKYFSK